MTSSRISMTSSMAVMRWRRANASSTTGRSQNRAADQRCASRWRRLRDADDHSALAGAARKARFCTAASSAAGVMWIIKKLRALSGASQQDDVFIMGTMRESSGGRSRRLQRWSIGPACRRTARRERGGGAAQPACRRLRIYITAPVRSFRERGRTGVVTDFGPCGLRFFTN